MAKSKLTILLSVVGLSILLFLYIFSQQKKTDSTPPPPSPTHVNWSVKTIKIENGWGFEIYQNKTKTILQQRIPAIPKSNPFVTELSAKKVGMIMLNKIKAGKSPSVSKSELIELGIVDSLLQPIPAIK